MHPTAPESSRARSVEERPRLLPADPEAAGHDDLGPFERHPFRLLPDDIDRAEADPLPFQQRRDVLAHDGPLPFPAAGRRNIPGLTLAICGRFAGQNISVCTRPPNPRTPIISRPSAEISRFVQWAPSPVSRRAATVGASSSPQALAPNRTTSGSSRAMSLASTAPWVSFW